MHKHNSYSYNSYPKSKLFYVTSNAWPPLSSKTSNSAQEFSQSHKCPKIISRSKIHEIIKEGKLTLKKDRIYFRRLTYSDVDQLQRLNMEWFPVEHEAVFYHNIVASKNIFSLGAFIYSEKIDQEFLVGAIVIKFQKDMFAFSKEAEIINKQDSCSSKYKRALYHYLANSNMGYIQSIGVIDELRREGIGTELLQKSLKFIRTHNYRCLGLYLHVAYYNQAAINFYEKNSFSMLKYIQGYYTIDEDKYPALMYGFYFDENMKQEKEPKKRKCFWCCTRSIKGLVYLVFGPTKFKKEYSKIHVKTKPHSSDKI